MDIGMGSEDSSEDWIKLIDRGGSTFVNSAFFKCMRHGVGRQALSEERG